MSLKEFTDAFLVGIEDVEIHNKMYGTPIFKGRAEEIPEHLYDFPLFQLIPGDNYLLIFLDNMEV